MARYDQYDDDDRDVREVDPPARPWILLLVLAAVCIALAGGMAWMFVARTHAADEARAAMRAEQAARQAEADNAAIQARLAEQAARQADLRGKDGDDGAGSPGENK